MSTVLVACSTPPSPTPTPEPPRTLTGTFTLHHEVGWSAETCRGDGGYGDIKVGLGVTLTNEDGRVIGTTSLPVGQTVDRLECVFAFTIDDVPDAEFYTLEVGRRGEVTYSYDELEARDWLVALEIGD